MAYNKQNFQPDQILKADHLNTIENGIVENERKIDSIHTHNNKALLDTLNNDRLSSWDNKSNFSGSYNDLTNKPTIPSVDGLATEAYVDGAISELSNDLQGQIDDLFQNVSNGKELIASAITDKGVDASEEETFQSLSEKIDLIPSGPPGSNIIGYIDEENDIYVSLTELESGTYTLKFEDYSGLLDDFDDIGNVEVE